jgi:hypothetical protein
MKKRTKIILIVSLSLNALVVLYIAASYVASMFISDYSIYTLNRYWACEQNYQNMLNTIDKDLGYDPARAEASKMVYAIEACQRNYKTGEKLDLQPLVDQVEATK